MIAKMLIGTVAATAVGVGSVSVAGTGSTVAGTGSPASASAAAAHGNHGKHPVLRQLARRAAHGEVVIQKKKDNSFVTVDVVHGAVTSVSSKSITVRAADKTSETYVITSDTHVRSRDTSTKKGAKSAISAVKTGDQVYVLGTGTSTKTAKLVVDVH